YRTYRAKRFANRRRRRLGFAFNARTQSREQTNYPRCCAQCICRRQQSRRPIRAFKKWRRHQLRLRKNSILARRRETTRLAPARIVCVDNFNCRYGRAILSDLLAAEINWWGERSREPKFQCLKCRTLVNAIAIFLSSAAAITSASFTEPPG